MILFLLSLHPFFLLIYIIYCFPFTFLRFLRFLLHSFTPADIFSTDFSLSLCFYSFSLSLFYLFFLLFSFFSFILFLLYLHFLSTNSLLTISYFVMVLFLYESLFLFLFSAFFCVSFSEFFFCIFIFTPYYTTVPFLDFGHFSLF